MALRGETVGTAYVRIVAFGEGLDDSIADTVRDSGDSAVVQQAGEDVGTRVDESIAEGIDKSPSSNAAVEKKVNGWAALMRRLKPASEDSGQAIETFGHKIRRWSASIRDAEFDTRGFGDQVGRVFGRGSRNDFVNFAGAFIGNATSGILGMVNGVRRLIFNIPDLVSGFTDFFKRVNLARQGMLQWSEVFSGAATKIGAFAARTGPLAAGLIVAVLGVLGPIAGLISGLAAALTALAASVTFALSAGLGVLVGLLPVLAAGVGAVVLAIQGLDKDKVKEFFDEFKQPVKELQNSLGRDLESAIESAMPGIRSAFQQLVPILQRVGNTFDFIGLQFGAVLNSPAFTQFVNALDRRLNPILKSLGSSVAQFSGALFGLFRATLPIAEEFAGWIEDIATQFNNWVNSKEGQRAVRDFLEEAADSAKAVGDFLGEVVKLVAELFDAGNEEGDALFQDMADAIERVVNFIKDNPEVVQQWFEDGVEIARELGEAIVGLIEIFDALDTPENRQFAADILDLFGKLAHATSIVIGFLEKMQTAFVNSFGPVVSLIKQGWQNLKTFIGFLRGLPEKISNFFSSISKNFAPRTWAAMINGPAILKAIMKKLPDIDVRDIFKVVGVAAKIFGSLPSPKELIAKMTFALTSIIESVGKVLGTVMGAFPRAAEIVGKMVFDLVRTIRSAGVTSTVMGAFPAAAEIVGKMAFDLLEVVDNIGSVYGEVLGAFPTASEILSHIGSVVIDVGVNLPDIPNLPGGASGFRNFSGGLALVGEQGPELLVVPRGSDLYNTTDTKNFLNRQENNVGPTRSIDVGGLTIITPTDDPAAVARETMNQLVASSYFG